MHFVGWSLAVLVVSPECLPLTWHVNLFEGCHSKCTVMVAAKKLRDNCEQSMMAWLEAGAAIADRSKAKDHKDLCLL